VRLMKVTILRGHSIRAYGLSSFLSLKIGYYSGSGTGSGELLDEQLARAILLSLSTHKLALASKGRLLKGFLSRVKNLGVWRGDDTVNHDKIVLSDGCKNTIFFFL